MRPEVGSSRRCAAALPVLSAIAVGCAAVSPAQWVHPTREQWREARAALESLKAGVPRTPYVATIATTLRDARSGRTVDGRGAIAIAPGEAVRMILVGGAGATLLDAWVTKQRWRVAVPPLDIVRRGGSENPIGLPVGFLRWWFVSPFDGTLFAAAVGPSRDLWLLRDRDAVIDLRRTSSDGKAHVTATRRLPGHAERIDQYGAGSSPLAASPGDRVAYVDETTGLRVTVAVESIAPAPPDPEAFKNPDPEGAPAQGGGT